MKISKEMLTNLIDSAKCFYKTKLNETLFRYKKISNSISHSHIKVQFTTIIEKITQLFKEEEQIININSVNEDSTTKPFFSELFYILKMICNCLQDVDSINKNNYFNNETISIFNLNTNSASSHTELLHQLRAFIGLIFLQLHNISSQMVYILSQSIIANKLEMYWGLLQQHSFQDFCSLYFQPDLNSFFNIGFESKMSLDNDLDIYKYAHFTAMLTEHLNGFENLFQNESDKIMLMMLFSYDCSFVDKSIMSDLIKECIHTMFTQIDYNKNAESWILNKMMKIVNCNCAVQFQFVEIFQGFLLERIAVQKKFNFLKYNRNTNNTGGNSLMIGNLRRHNNRISIKEDDAKVEIMKCRKIILFLKNYKWIDLDKVKKVIESYNSYIGMIEEKLKRVNI